MKKIFFGVLFLSILALTVLTVLNQTIYSGNPFLAKYFDGITSYDPWETELKVYPEIEDLDAHQIAYEKELTEINNQRNKLKKRYQTEADKQAVLNDTKAYLQTSLSEKIFPYWYGTTWDFNGYTAKPRQGLIACGYFISTPMQQIGFNLNRYRLAQQAASNIIKSLVPGKDQKTYTDLERMLKEVGEAEDALYVIGLDFHVGFIEKKGNRIEFIHSSYSSPPGSYVVRENARASACLPDSNILVLGKITNDSLAKKWLFGERIKVLIS